MEDVSDKIQKFQNFVTYTLYNFSISIILVLVSNNKYHKRKQQSLVRQPKWFFAAWPSIPQIHFNFKTKSRFDLRKVWQKFGADPFHRYPAIRRNIMGKSVCVFLRNIFSELTKNLIWWSLQCRIFSQLLPFLGPRTFKKDSKIWKILKNWKYWT